MVDLPVEVLFRDNLEPDQHVYAIKVLFNDGTLVKWVRVEPSGVVFTEHWNMRTLAVGTAEQLRERIRAWKKESNMRFVPVCVTRKKKE